MISSVELDQLLESPAELMNPANNKHLLANMSSPQVADYLKKDQRIILPIGSTEQHGPDAITGIDHITATGIAYAVSQLTGVLCAPPLNYGMAMHHLGFSGTMAIRPTTYINLICDLISSLKRHGFKKLIVINGHGGNKGPFQNALAERIDEFSEKEGYHATPTEVSVAMALIPGSMTMPPSYKCPQKEVPNDNVGWVIPNKFKDYYPDGVMRADYSGSTEAIGREALKQAIVEIADLL
jgi:creatinine amidohydrolase